MSVANGQLCSLVGAIGTPRFDEAFLRLACDATDCDHLTAFAFRSEEPPRILMASNVGDLPVARPIADKYVSLYWRLDPVTRVADPRAQIGAAVRVRSNEIEHSAYRHDCYGSVGLVDRFSIMQPRGQETIRINFYRTLRKGGFALSSMEPLVSSAELLIEVLAKHDAVRSVVRDDPAESFARRLGLVAPDLPKRETEVCVGIAMGFSSEAIALRLGLSINTVLTYRKRAYRHLGISSQNELLRLMLH